MERYGASPADLANIAVAFRRNASKNPMAIMRGRRSPWRPTSRSPSSWSRSGARTTRLVSEGATCLIVTSRERARDLAAHARADRGRLKRSTRGATTTCVFARPGMGVGISRETPVRDDPARAVYARAGITTADVDALYVYDSFTSNVWMSARAIRLLRRGRGVARRRQVGLDLDARLPVNTNGGLLSEAHLLGYGHIIEMVRQLPRRGGSPAAGEGVGAPVGDAARRLSRPDTLMQRNRGRPWPARSGDPSRQRGLLEQPRARRASAPALRGLRDVALPGVAGLPPLPVVRAHLGAGLAGGTVAAAVVVRRATGDPAWGAHAPFASGIVDLAHGLRLPGRILCTCGEGLRRGSAVRAVVLTSSGHPAVMAFGHACVSGDG